MLPPDATCPCGTGLPYADCCRRYHRSEAWPESPEKLMRARYSAFSTGEVSFLVESVDPPRRHTVKESEARAWSEGSEWLGLRVIGTSGGTEDETEGTVEFEAHYRTRESDEEVHHHELATFRRRDGRWFFVDGKLQGQEPIQRTEPRVGRNDPCPCGSGKKYKKCCGRG